MPIVVREPGVRQPVSDHKESFFQEKRCQLDVPLKYVNNYPCVTFTIVVMGLQMSSSSRQNIDICGITTVFEDPAGMR
ncbi:MAG: hypothetical protein ACLPN1_02925 [Dissulfurispiraceae bacterium]